MARRPICFGSGVAMACCGVAHAEFNVRMVDAASLGSPIHVNGSLFLSSAAPGMSPNEIMIEGSSPDQWAEYGSYVAIDSGPSHPGAVGVKNDGYQANPGDLAHIGNPFGIAGQIGASWFMDPAGPRPRFEATRSNLFGGFYAAFLGRFSFRSTSGTPSGSLSLGVKGVIVQITDGPIIETGSSNDFFVNFSSFDAPVQHGVRVDLLGHSELRTPYMLTLIEWNAGPRPGGTARWIGYDMYIVQLPEPGVYGMSVFGVVCASRRRRA